MDFLFSTEEIHMLSLKDLCVQTIVNHFERYNTAFSTTEDANLKRMLQFLQRVYSFQIAYQLRDRMKENYMDFLINKYLKVLHTYWLKDCSWKTIAAKFAEVGSSLEKIVFDDYSEEFPWQDIICYLSNLELISFPDSCEDEILKCIAKFCPNIIEIDVKNSEVTDDGLKHLCNKENGKSSCSKLKRLFIYSCPVNDEGVKYLIKNLPSLEIIDYHELPQLLYSIHKNDLQTLDKVQPYRLNSLDLLNMTIVPFFSDLLKICLTLCPYLKFLTCPVFEQKQLDLFSGLSDLEKLHLECNGESSLNINDLLKAKGSNLMALTIHNCSISVLTLADSCRRLKHLCWNQVTCQNHDGSVPVLHNLETFAVENFTYDLLYSKSVCLILSSSPNLELIAFKRCDLSACEVKTQILKCCEQCPVKNINFSGSVVEMQFVKDILITCRSLKCFYLDDCNLNSDEEDEIYKCAEILSNNPDVYFSEQLSLSDYEDIFDDNYNDFDIDDDDDDDDNDDDYDDYYLHHDDDDEDYDDVYGYFSEIYS